MSAVSPLLIVQLAQCTAQLKHACIYNANASNCSAVLLHMQPDMSVMCPVELYSLCHSNNWSTTRHLLCIFLCLNRVVVKTKFL